MTEHNPKHQLRQEAMKNRARMDVHHENPDDVIPLFFDSIKPKQGQVISFYVPMYREFDCWTLMEDAHEKGFVCVLPVIQKNCRELLFAPWTPNTEMQEGAYKIPCPAYEDEDLQEPDIVISPLLAFDRRGFRLGMGGGYYDTTLHSLRRKKEIVAVGVAHSQQACLFNLPVEDHDEKLDWVITPQGTHYFGA